MNNISERDLDNLFKKAAEEYDIPFDDNAWEELNDRLEHKEVVELSLNRNKIAVGIWLMFILLCLLMWLGYLS
ncbi:hypothetical protein FNH22_01445 [Fulvivirga sp. M361]|uniref:hypothetical protein n=1 Tax=Fulvivirga sp. M361 TaxID=2594266 RepID=UPI00117A5967|nr:hypothetical protein [Fulvivirga sp. M361]TRX62018.1 hypothetical protein FNH22_01445 [Fulvivirga sp. M361]